MKTPVVRPSNIPAPSNVPGPTSGIPIGYGPGGPLPNPTPWTNYGSYVQYGYGVVVGQPSGGNLGPGSINASSLFINGVPISTGPANAAVLVSDTPPVGVADDTMWWQSSTGLLFIYYNDGNSTQWVIACPQPDTTTFLMKAGDTMNGPLMLSANPTAPMQAATKQYVDNSLNRTRTVLATVGSGTYTLPSGCAAINVRMVGGGGGGGGSSNGTNGGAGGAGGNTTFGSLTANGGAGNGNAAACAPGGGASGGDFNLAGGQGGGSGTMASGMGASGGASVFGGGGGSGAYANPGGGGSPGTGGGGGGGGSVPGGGWSGAGGGAGGYCEKLIVGPSGTYAYTVGAGGHAGAAGTSGYAGGVGGSGLIIIDEYY